MLDASFLWVVELLVCIQSLENILVVPAEQGVTHGKLQRTAVSWISGNICFQNELSVDGITCLKMMSIKRVSTNLKGLWKEEMLRWTSSWTNKLKLSASPLNFSELAWPH